MTPGQTCAGHACIGCTSPGLQHPVLPQEGAKHLLWHWVISQQEYRDSRIMLHYSGLGGPPPIYNKYPRCYHRERSRKQPESRPTQFVFSISGHEKSTPGCGSPDGSASDNELPKCPGATHHLLHSKRSKCLPLRGHLHILGLTASSLAVVPLGDCSNSCHQAFMISHSESFTPMWRRLGQLFFTV